MKTGDEKVRGEIEGRLRVLPMRDFEAARLQALFEQAVHEGNWREALELHLNLIYILFCTTEEFEDWVKAEYSISG